MNNLYVLPSNFLAFHYSRQICLLFKIIWQSTCFSHNNSLLIINMPLLSLSIRWKFAHAYVNSDRMEMTQSLLSDCGFLDKLHACLSLICVLGLLLQHFHFRDFCLKLRVFPKLASQIIHKLHKI